MRRSEYFLPNTNLPLAFPEQLCYNITIEYQRFAKAIKANRVFTAPGGTVCLWVLFSFPASIMKLELKPCAEYGAT
jgi:hypothetical protein